MRRLVIISALALVLLAGCSDSRCSDYVQVADRSAASAQTAFGLGDFQDGMANLADVRSELAEANGYC